MPTSSETYWNIKRLNKLFALAAVLLAVALIWAVAHDYARPWRAPQRSARIWEAALLHHKLDRALASPSATQPAGQAEIAQLQRKLDALAPQTFAGQLAGRIRSAPLLQFISPTERIRQIILKDVLTDLSFARTETVDRCITCHVNIDRPEFSLQRVIQFLESALAARSAAPDGTATAAVTFWRAWGNQLLSPAEQRRARSVAAIREAIQWKLDPDARETLEHRYRHFLIDQLNIDRRQQGQPPLDPSPLMLAHPRLDLYLGPNSPHAMETVGCTSCHDGAGAETDFSLAVHTPKRTWVDHHTGQPVLPLQLHPPTDAPSDINDQVPYTDPATGLTGTAIAQADYWSRHYERESGATLAQARRHWDRPMLDARYVQSSCARCHPPIHDIRDQAPLLHQGRSLFSRLGCVNCHAMDSIPPEDKPRVGPDLRHIAEKLSPAFIQAWIWSPRDFRPTTRMPHFFQQENNASPEDIQRTQDEVRLMTAYLLKTSTPIASSATMPLASEDRREIESRRARGRALFIGLRDAQAAIPDQQGGVGCIGCHTNANETAGSIPQYFAPELSALGTKLLFGDRPKSEARRWLWQWLIDPRPSSPNTPMPHLRLTPQEALDLAEYLLAEEGSAPRVLPDAPLHPDLDRARKLISHYGCARCHAINGLENASPPGPDLSDWGQKRADQLFFGLLASEIEPTPSAWLKHKLQNPRIYDRGQVFPAMQKLRMPKFTLTDQQIRALITFVISNRERLISPALLARSDTPQSRIIARGRQIAERYNCIGCHRIDGPEPLIRQYWLQGYFDEIDLATHAPPSLRGEGSRIRHEWLFNYLQHVEGEGTYGRIRPLPFVRMPSFFLGDGQTTALVAYFSAAARREARDLAQRLAPLLRDPSHAGPAGPRQPGFPPDDWFQSPIHSDLADFLKSWAITNTPQVPVDFAPANTPESLALAYKTALYDARFISHLFDAPYPFLEYPRPVSTGQQFSQGEDFYHLLQCHTCHVLGEERDGRVNPAPRGPNLALVHRRLQRRWVRRWLQEPQLIQPGAVMPPFFTGRAVPSPDNPNKVLFQLDGLPYMLPPLTAEQIRQIQATYGQTVEQQTQRLLDFLYAAGLQDYTSPDPSPGKPTGIGNK